LFASGGALWGGGKIVGEGVGVHMRVQFCLYVMAGRG